MAASTIPPFPWQGLVYAAFACAVTGAALLFTKGFGDDWQKWWSARNWPAVTCRVVQVEPQLRYQYRSADGQTHESGAIGIHDIPPAEILDGKGPGAELPCFVNPADPRQAWLDRDFAGWWGLPGAWVLAAFLLIVSIPGFLADFWTWATFRENITWAEWLATFYSPKALLTTVAGIALILPGLAATKWITFDPWWNWWRAQTWTEGECEVTKSVIHFWSGGSGRHRTGGWWREVAFRYEYGGKPYQNTHYSPWRLGRVEWESAQSLDVGERKPCFISPDDPSRAYMWREMSKGAYVAGALGPLLMLVGWVILCVRPR